MQALDECYGVTNHFLIAFEIEVLIVQNIISSTVFLIKKPKDEIMGPKVESAIVIFLNDHTVKLPSKYLELTHRNNNP